MKSEKELGCQLQIAMFDAPALKVKCFHVSSRQIRMKSTRRRVDSMIHTMDLASGCGLASTQVFGDLRLFVARLSDESGVPYVEAFFNPIIIWSSEEIVGAWEGCLSYPNLMAFVYRHASIGVEYLDSSAVRKSVTFCENNARIVQHEMDHLEGITTMQKVAFQYRHLSTTCQQ